MKNSIAFSIIIWLFGVMFGLMIIGILLEKEMISDYRKVTHQSEISDQYIRHNVYDRDTTLISTTYHQYVMISGRGKKLEHLVKCKCKQK